MRLIESKPLLLREIEKQFRPSLFLRVADDIWYLQGKCSRTLAIWEYVQLCYVKRL